MEKKRQGYEKIMAGVEEIATILGISLNGLPALELFAMQAYISGVLGGNAEIAEKIIKLALSKAHGNNPEKELRKLQKKVSELDLKQISQGPKSLLSDLESLKTAANDPIIVHHFSKRTRLAQSRLPATGGIFSRWKDQGNIIRGPKKLK